MGGKNSAPAPPDYGPLLAANEKTAAFAQKLANEQWQWAKSVYNENKGLMKDTNTSFLKSMEMGRVAAEEDRARYKAIYQPMEDRLTHEANTYDTQDRRDMEAGAAQASVAQQFDAARNTAQQQLESFGVNPSATRFAALDLNARLAEAATKAGAGTAALRGVEDKARALRAGAVDIGKGYPASYTAAGQLGLNAGANAQGGTQQAFQTGAQAMGTGPQWLGGSNEALGNWGNTLNNQYQNQIDQYKANQQSSSGFGSAFGTLAGIGMKMYGFEEGGVVPAEMSPSRGAMDDDVPAAVSVGEVIVPSDVVNWLGEKHFNKLAEKARKEKSETQAVPADDAGVRQYAGGGVVESGQNPIPVFPTPGIPGIPRWRVPGYQPPPAIPGWRGKIPGYQPPPPGGFRPGPTIPGWGKEVVMPVPAPIPHYGPDPGKGAIMPVPAPIPHPGFDPTGSKALIDPSLYPTQTAPTGKWAGR